MWRHTVIWSEQLGPADYLPSNVPYWRIMLPETRKWVCDKQWDSFNMIRPALNERDFLWYWILPVPIGCLSKAHTGSGDEQGCTGIWWALTWCLAMKLPAAQSQYSLQHRDITPTKLYSNSEWISKVKTGMVTPVKWVSLGMSCVDGQSLHSTNTLINYLVTFVRWQS